MSTTEKSYWLKSGLFSFFEKGSVFLFGFGSFFFLVRELTPEAFGAWVVFLATASFIEVGRAGLLQNAVIKYLATCEAKDYGKISSASLFINVSLTLFSVGFLLIFAKGLSHWLNFPELYELFYIYAITTAFLIPMHQFNFIQQANLDFRGIFWSNFTKQGLFFAFVSIYYFGPWQLEILALAKFQVLTAFAGASVSYFFAKPYLKFDRMIDKHWVLTLFHYGKYVFGTNLSAMLYKTIDKFMLSNLSIGATAAVSVYEAAIRVTNLAEVPTFSVASVVFPQGAKQIETGGKPAIKILYEKSVGAILAIIAPFLIFVLLFPEFIIMIIAGEQYIESAGILRFTILYGLFLPFAIQFGTVLDSMGRPKINFLFTVFGAILNVFFNYIFIINYGIVGAAYGTLTTYGVTFVLNQFVLYKILDIKAYRAFPYMIGFYKEGYQMLLVFLQQRSVAKEQKLK
ncbi:MAG: flippase [Saprospiraceae bacterium]